MSVSEWNVLTPDEVALRERLRVQEEVRSAILAALSRLNISCQHRWREEKGWKVTGCTRLFYPNHPTCLICGEWDEFEKYCPSSPTKTCVYGDGGGGGLDRLDLDLGDCAHCGEPHTPHMEKR